jgi:hypothetical protein
LDVFGVSRHQSRLFVGKGIGTGSDHGYVESVDDDQRHNQRGELKDEVDRI